jgi:hypothetical protein
MDEFTVPPRRYSTMPPTVPAPLGQGLKPGQFRAYCRSDLKAGHPPSQAWSGEVVQYSGQEQLALFVDHFNWWHPPTKDRPKLTFKRPKKNTPWRAPKQKDWTPKPGDPGTDVTLNAYGLCQVWCWGDAPGTVWVIPYDSIFTRPILVGKYGTVVRVG